MAPEATDFILQIASRLAKERVASATCSYLIQLSQLRQLLPEPLQLLRQCRRRPCGAMRYAPIAPYAVLRVTALLHHTHHLWGFLAIAIAANFF